MLNGFPVALFTATVAWIMLKIKKIEWNVHNINNFVNNNKSQRRRFKNNFDKNDDGDKNNAYLVDADCLIFVGEVAGEKIQGGSGGVDLHCALQYLITIYFGEISGLQNLSIFDENWKRQTNDFLPFGIEICYLCKT